MKVLVTGGGGQLAKALADTAQDHVELSVRAMDSLDVTSKTQIEEEMRNFQPEVVINTAAYTAVDAPATQPASAQHQHAYMPQRRHVGSCAWVGRWAACGWQVGGNWVARRDQYGKLRPRCRGVASGW